MKLFLAGFALFIGGCGYQQAGVVQADPAAGEARASLYRQDVRTVALPIFTNQTFHRNVEFDLSKSLANHLESHTPYKIAPADRADTILEGHIVDVRINTISSDHRAAVPQEQLMSLRVDFVWKDLRTGRILAERRGFEQTGTYYPTLGEGRFAGSQMAVERLAVAIVQELQAEW